MCHFLLDVTPPSIQCPQNIVINNDPGKPHARVTLPNPTSSDNSGIAATITISPPNINKIHDFSITSDSGTQVTYVATDHAGLKRSCSFFVKVKGGLKFVSYYREERSIEFQKWSHIRKVEQLSATFSLPRSTVWTQHNHNKKRTLYIGKAWYRTVGMRMWRTFIECFFAFLMCCSLYSAYTLLIFHFVVDAEKPRVLDCPQNVTLFTSKNPVRVMWTVPTFKDNFDPTPRIENKMNPGSLLNWGIYKNEYTCTDKAGNKAFCKFDIEVGRKCAD